MLLLLRCTAYSLPSPSKRRLGAKRRGAAWGLLAKFCKFLAGSFSAVSKRNFARKYAFCSIFQNQPDYLTEFFEIWQNFTNKPQAAPLRFAPRRRGGGLEGICRAEVDSRTAASPRGETIAVQQWQRISWSGNARRPLATLTWVKEEGEGHIAVDVLRWNL